MDGMSTANIKIDAIDPESILSHSINYYISSTHIGSFIAKCELRTGHYVSY